MTTLRPCSRRIAALTSAGYHDETPPDPDAAARESIRAFAPMAPSVNVAAALLIAADVRPVPVDRETLEPTGAPLLDLAAVDAHWRANYTDGVGVRAGVQPKGSTVFALRGTNAALRDWLAEVAPRPTRSATSTEPSCTVPGPTATSPASPGSAGQHRQPLQVAALPGRLPAHR
jgi:hypothetical protein